MKKYLLLILILLFLLFPYTVEASEMGTSVPTGSQYAPNRNYGFQIKCDDIPNIVTVTFEWDGLDSFTPTNFSNTYYYNLSDLQSKDYSYRWIIENTSDTSIFSNTYSILKNSSTSFSLTLDDTEGNKSYRRYTIANFIARLNVPNKQIKLDSTYPGWVTLPNSTSVIYSSTNLTELGVFTLTASWDGDQNYTASSKTHYFDSGPPQFSNPETTPKSPFGYVPNTEYKFKINCIDATLTSVWFELNYTGTMKTYYSNSDPPLQNSSGVFWISFIGLGVKDFAYRWHAKDNLNDESMTDFVNYQILKMSPLIMDVLPSTNVKEDTQITATCYSINPLDINTSKFNFYKDSDIIPNITPSTRMGTFILSAGTYNFTCNTSGTGNYTNQSITRTITVLSSSQQQDEISGELKIKDVNFPTVKAGEAKEASFKLSNEMTKNLFNLTTTLGGISSDWYDSEKLASIYIGETKTVKINFTVPSDAEGKTYSLVINVNGKTSDGRSINAAENVDMQITSTAARNRPPSFSTGRANRTSTGETTFVLELYDDRELSGYIFSSNISGSWENDSWTPMSGDSDFINVAKNIGTASVVAWKIYANDSSNEWSESEVYIFNAAATAAGSDMFFVLIILMAVIVFIVVIVIFVRKGKGKKEEVEYVYSREQIENEKRA